MQVAFLGLFGPQGVLPRHYTQLIIDRTRQRDTSLRDFLDLFNHRVISLFWRVWAKHRLPIAFEEAQRGATGAAEDLFTFILYCLVGQGTRGLRQRMEFRDSALLYFAGHFAQARPQAVTLQAIVAEYFGISAEVVQFCGQWLLLDRADQSQLSGQTLGYSRQPPPNNQLGLNTVVGERVWSVENRFRVRLGPMDYRQFAAFTPDGPLHVPLAQLIRTHAGPEYDFDVQLVLRRDQVPMSRLTARDQPPTSRLGWNCWIYNQAFDHDADDAAFTCEGLPTHG
jgi:type VI secretion system protein ImpH